MSWLEKGISSLKGQITNFTKEVLADEDPDSTDAAAAAAAAADDAGAAGGGSSGGSRQAVEGLTTAAHDQPTPLQHEQQQQQQSEGFFGQASAALSVLPGLPLFGRSSPTLPPGQEQGQDRLRQHCVQLESTVQRLLQQLEEVAEARDKESLELATLRRELRLRGQGDSGPGSGSGSRHGDSPQLPDDGSVLAGPDGTGISPALSDDGFTKLDPSETELWEATQELSQSLEAQVELHKKELEKCYQMKQDWLLEKTNLEGTIEQLQKQLNALQDWQSPDPDFANGNETKLHNTIAKLQKENELLQNEKVDALERLKVVESKLFESEKEKAELSVNMEELDSQTTETLNQLLEIKKGIQDKYDSLKLEHENLSSNFKKVKEERDNLMSVEMESVEISGRFDSLKSQFQLVESEKEDLLSKLSSLQSENNDLLSKLSSFQSENNDLLSKLSSFQSENNDLLGKIDSIQLDLESLEVKYSTLLSENGTLKTKLGAAQCDLDSANSELSERMRVDDQNTSETNCSDMTSTEKYVIDKLKNIVSLEIPEEYFKDIAVRDGDNEKELEAQLDMVAALVKMTVDLRWKNDTLERNLVEYTRQLRDLSAQLSSRDKQVVKLEEECVMLRENMESLLDGLNVTPEKGMLPSIPETSEAGDDELLDAASNAEHSNEQHFLEGGNKANEEVSKTIEKLENELENLREARSNLEHETKRLRAELHELTSRLRSSESMLRNQDNLERDVERWRKQCEKIRNTHEDLQKENLQLKEEAEMARFGQDSLQAEVSEWKTIADTVTQERQDAIRAKELLAAEVAELKANLTAADCISSQLEQATQIKTALESEVSQLKKNLTAMNESNKNLDDANAAIMALQDEVAVLKQELLVKDKAASEINQNEVAELLHKIDSLESQKRNLELSLSELGSENASICEHVMTLQQKCDSLSADLACKASSEYDNTQNFLHEKQALEEQVTRMTSNYERVKKNLEDLGASKSTIENELDQSKLSLKEAQEKVQTYEISLQQKLENELCLNEQIEAMIIAKHASEQEVKNLQDQLQQLQSTSPSATQDENNSSTIETLERKLHSMLEEKEQILSVLNEKTRDNSVLRSENQKLLAAMSNQSDNQQSPAVTEQSAQLLQHLNQLQLERDQLISTVQIKHNESLRYHAEILRLNSLLEQNQQELAQTCDQGNDSAKVTSSTNKNQEVLALEAKCANLAASLQEEKSQNAYLQNEMQEQHEKEAMLTRELDRLRAHMVEVEETYTAEALRLEEQAQDLQGKLNVAEGRLRNVATAHTSASILANQHVESLQGQSRLIGQQRDELQSKLSAVEDREQKHAAALRNLQAVLEQFQREKEQDLKSLTEKLRLELQSAHKKHDELTQEIKLLQGQLNEAKEGLSAAARLGVQLDKKSETINSLREQINQHQKELKVADERIQAASQSVEGKVDKSLVKNLVVGLLTAPANTRSPALRVVASVLDFNHDERQRVGLEQGLTSNEQSLSEAFVRFLESESRPQMQLRLLPEASPTSVSSKRKDSQVSTGPGESPIRKSPLLSEVVLPTLAPLPAGRSSGSILKDVLKNDV
ncbi:thyroid receptor-interacting protein 11 isoform X2 [Frankliniella occidentalis]|uniref:Thyroid receptor-interacting protein 11 isoform X2 n=1 Tax=Frankliniella occidentalis TaxID=133901 RepID=A0A9C6U3C5_FRAOC|nr:thyroid receptor-interacting protein 11 isoform X2 [Frankliniella occidentalis]